MPNKKKKVKLYKLLFSNYIGLEVYGPSSRPRLIAYASHISMILDPDACVHDAPIYDARICMMHISMIFNP